MLSGVKNSRKWLASNEKNLQRPVKSSFTEAAHRQTEAIRYASQPAGQRPEIKAAVPVIDNLAGSGIARLRRI